MVWLPTDLGARTDPVNVVSEDCLTLDVVVPKSVWDNRNSRGIQGKPSALGSDLGLICVSQLRLSHGCMAEGKLHLQSQ